MLSTISVAIIFLQISSNIYLTKASDNFNWSEFNKEENLVLFQCDNSSIYSAFVKDVFELQQSLSHVIEKREVLRNHANYIQEMRKMFLTVKNELMENDNRTHSTPRKMGKLLLPRSCDEAMKPKDVRGVYKLYLPDFGLDSFYVYCERDEKNVPWLVIKRQIYLKQNSSLIFNRHLNDYKYGFGNMENEFFIGMEKIHALTDFQLQELYITLKTKDGNELYDHYEHFAIGTTKSSYYIKVLSKSTGTANNTLWESNGQEFQDCSPGSPWQKKYCLDSKYCENHSFVWNGFDGPDLQLETSQLRIRPNSQLQFYTQTFQ